LPEATNVGGRSIFWALIWLREVALPRNYDIHFRAFSNRYRSGSGAHEPGPQNFWNALIRQKLRRQLVLKTTTIEKGRRLAFSQSASGQAATPYC
jgi:hypothetical protein